jgi:AcrR family transcriptional regulator
MNTKESILNTAFILFLEKGYTGVSLNDILNRIGITKGGFYHYFTSKDELFENVLNAFVINPMKEFEKYISDIGGDIFQFLSEFFNSYVYMIDELIKLVEQKENVYGYYQLIFSAKNRITDFDRKMAQIYRGITKSVEIRIREALDKGAVREDIEPASYAYHITALCEGLATLWIMDKEKDFMVTFRNSLNNVIRDIQVRNKG